MSGRLTARAQWTIVALVAATLGAVLLIANRTIGDELYLVGIGTRAPEFHAATLDATPKPRRIEDYRGSVVLLNVWATYCQPCIVEMPSIERLYHDYGPQGLRVVAVSVDDADKQTAIRDFVAAHALTFDILYDPSGGIEQTYQTTGVPETFIIGRDGVIRKKVIGASDWDSPGNRALISQLLHETAS